MFDVVGDYVFESFEIVDEDGKVTSCGEVGKQLFLVSAGVVSCLLEFTLEAVIFLTWKLQNNIGNALLEAHRFELHDVLWLALSFGRNVPKEVLWYVMFLEELLEKLRALELKLVFRFLPCVRWLFG